MKIFKIIPAILIFTLSCFTAISQEAQVKSIKKTEKIEIQTSAQCQMCKDRIEKDMAYKKGVKSVDLDIETKILTIEYRTGKTDPQKLKEAISKIGYDADDVAYDTEAYKNLPACCQKGGHDNNK